MRIVHPDPQGPTGRLGQVTIVTCRHRRLPVRESILHRAANGSATPMGWPILAPSARHQATVNSQPTQPSKRRRNQARDSLKAQVHRARSTTSSAVSKVVVYTAVQSHRS